MAIFTCVMSFPSNMAQAACCWKKTMGFTTPSGFIFVSLLKKNCQTKPTSPHVVWEGFKKNYRSSSKKNSSKFSCQTQLELQMGLASMVRWNKKMSFLAANTKDGFGEHRDKKVPHVYNDIYCCIFDVVGLFLLFCWRSWTSCLDTWHHGFYRLC